MDQYLMSATAELRHHDLLRDAEQVQLRTPPRERHAWRHRLGEAFIRLGRYLANERAAAQTA